MKNSLKLLIKNGDFEKFKKKYHNNNYNNELFADACYYGKINIAKWLLSNNQSFNIFTWLFNNNQVIDISYNEENAFRVACSNGQLEVAKWLLQIKPDIDILARNNYAFTFVCNNGHLEVAKWLLSVKPTINISANEESSFRFACVNNYIHVAKWLLSVKSDINIFAENDFAFCCASRFNKLEVAKWLQTLKPNKYELVIENNIIVRYNVKKELPYNDNNTIKLNDLDECPICYSNNVNIQTECKHNFCTDCISCIYKDEFSCPYCRQTVNLFTKIVRI